MNKDGIKEQIIKTNKMLKIIAILSFGMLLLSFMMIFFELLYPMTTLTIYLFTAYAIILLMSLFAIFILCIATIGKLPKC